MQQQQRAPTSWVIDPDDPRAPPQELWDRMTPDERQRVLDTLPSEFEVSEASPPEGDFHFNPKAAAKETLGGYFQRIGRRVYLACELPVYYPAERMFAPDLIAVLDVEVKERSVWSASAEGKGVDLAMEVLWSGSSKKDLEDNVTRYAALGIPEYFVFDRRRRRLRGFRLAAGSARYQPIVPQEGRLTSAVLGLDLGLEGDRLRFFHGLAPLPETHELLTRLGAMVGDLEARLDETEQRLDEERQRTDEERQRADDAERRLAEALAELERLRRERG
ncbi:Uma2 family endonuclease [Sorangium sp. So ce131]|uniref:Uma2 family endonuclease n=1 Tax=Sorangium sp. So ce131 TaxID=3133282 RepID=UPI003F63F84A